SEVEHLTSTTVPFRYSLRYKDRLIDDVATIHSDEYFFKVFDFELLAGSPQTVLKEAHSIVISEKTAQRTFVNQDLETVLGEMLTIDNEAYTISGIMKTPPSNSHLKFDAII